MFKALSVFPASSRDVTVIAPLTLSVAAVEKHIRDMRIAILEDVTLIDLYEPKDTEERNLTFRLTFRKADRTLKDAEVDKEREKVAQGKFTYHAQYFHFLFQLLQYDPDAKEKLRNLVEVDYAYWRAAIQRAIATGELREDVDVEDAVVMFRQVYMGLSFEMAFMGGLNTQRLAKHLHAVYSLLKR